MNKIKVFANHYYNLGLNVTCICSYISPENLYYKNILKSPVHKWKHLINSKQDINEFESYDWDNAKGLGSVAGYQNLRVIDIDGCSDFSIIIKILQILGLPNDYEWITISGSNNGFHIYYFGEKFSYLKNNETVTSFPPKDEYADKIDKIEFLWEAHVVLPPSLHKSGNYYSFKNNSMPVYLPNFVKFEKISELINNLLVNDKINILTSYGEELIEFKPPINLTEFLKNQINENGIEILEQKQRIKAIFVDLLPNEKKTQYLLELSLRASIPQKLYSIFEKERLLWSIEIKALKEILKNDFSLEDKAVNSIFECWIDVLLMQKNN